MPADGTNNVIVALFSPDRIQFYDWREFSGGYYKRFREKEPNQSADRMPGNNVPGDSGRH